MGEDFMRSSLLWKLLLVFILALLSPLASAQTWGPVTAHVTMIDASNMGSRSGDPTVPVIFNIDQAISGNPCGTVGAATATLVYSPVAFADGSGDATHPTGNDRQLANSRAILATLQLAIATGYNVKLLGFNGGSGICQVYNVQILNF